MRPFVITLTPEIAKPFVDEYAASWGLPYPEDTNGGLKVHWIGAVYKGKIRAVAGLSAFPEGTYVHGFYSEDSRDGQKSLLALCKVIYGLNTNLYGFIIQANKRMQDYCFKHGWGIVKETETEVLVMHPAKVAAVC